MRETGERYAEPTLLLAEAVLRHQRGDDARPTFARAVEVATAGGGTAILRRVQRVAAVAPLDGR